MLRFGSTTCNSDRRRCRRLALPPSSPSSSSSFGFSIGLVPGDLNCSSTIGGMSSFGHDPEDDEKDTTELPAVSAAAAAPPVHGDDLLPSPRRRALDSFEPLMSMASFDDHHHHFFVDDYESHNTMNPRTCSTRPSRHQAKQHDEHDYDDDDDDDHVDETTKNASSSASKKRITSSSSSSSTYNGDDNASPSSTPGDGLPMPMADPDDESNGFSPTICLVRQQLEFFLADKKDAAARRKKGGVSGNVRAGSLGFRCIHCKHLPSRERAPSADAYPNQVQLIYQAVRNFQRHHFLKCPSVPQRLKDQYQSMPRRRKSKKPVHGHKHTNPWVYSANRKGLSDVEDGTSKGGYRIAYTSPPPPAVVSSATSSSSSAASAAPSSTDASHADASMYYGRPAHEHAHEYAIAGLDIPPTPIQLKEPKRKKSRRS